MHNQKLNLKAEILKAKWFVSKSIRWMPRHFALGWRIPLALWWPMSPTSPAARWGQSDSFNWPCCFFDVFSPFFCLYAFTEVIQTAVGWLWGVGGESPAYRLHAKGATGETWNDIWIIYEYHGMFIWHGALGENLKVPKLPKLAAQAAVTQMDGRQCGKCWPGYFDAVRAGYRLLNALRMYGLKLLKTFGMAYGMRKWLSWIFRPSAGPFRCSL